MKLKLAEALTKTAKTDYDTLTLTLDSVQTFKGEYAGCGSHQIELEVTLDRKDVLRLREMLASASELG